MTVCIRGIGWLTQEGYGCVATGREYRFDEGESVNTLAKKGLFSHPFRNFGRLDATSRMTTCAVALALKDAGIAYSPTEKQEIGIVGTSSEGSLASDMAYFNDYVTNGRTLSRGNLFIYTLPSSSLGEAAIHFGLTGPLLFTTGGPDAFGDTMSMAAEMVAGGEAHRMLVGRVAPDEALYFLLDREQGGNSMRSLDETRSLVASTCGVSEQVRRFLILKDTKGRA
jgi:3-oxoacyl-[acyl-carrier-protein] synthase II